MSLYMSLCCRIDAVASLVDMVVEGLEARKHALGKCYSTFQKPLTALTTACYSINWSHAGFGMYHIRGSGLRTFLCVAPNSPNFQSGLRFTKAGRDMVSLRDTQPSPFPDLCERHLLIATNAHVKNADDTTLCIIGNSKNEPAIQTFKELNMCL